MVLKQMVLVIKTDSGTYSNTFLTKPSLLRRTVRETITEYLPWRTLLFTMRTLHSCSKIWNASSTFILQFNHKFLACKKKLKGMTHSFWCYAVCSRNEHTGQQKSSLNILLSNNQQLHHIQEFWQNWEWTRRAEAIKQHTFPTGNSGS